MWNKETSNNGFCYKSEGGSWGWSFDLRGNSGGLIDCSPWSSIEDPRPDIHFNQRAKDKYLGKAMTEDIWKLATNHSNSDIKEFKKKWGITHITQLCLGPCGEIVFAIFDDEYYSKDDF
jgi:hypothetical protein